MQILIEPIDGGFRARPWNDTAEGATPQEALRQLLRRADELRKSGTLIDAEADPSANPWQEAAGIFEGDEDYDAWQTEVRNYRNQRDAEPDAA